MDLGWESGELNLDFIMGTERSSTGRENKSHLRESVKKANLILFSVILAQPATFKGPIKS